MNNHLPPLPPLRKTIQAGLKIPGTIWVLGMVSMLMDISSELVHSLLPLFMIQVLSSSIVSIGFIEGIAEASALIIKVFSGTLSDRLGKRRPLVLLGYSLSALSKPVFALAWSIQFVFAARLFDRLGKGIRGAPRDALIADYAPKSLQGAAYGLCQSLDTFGAFIGPLLAIGLMLLTSGNYRLIFTLAILPALISVLLIVFKVFDAPQQDEQPPVHINWQSLRALDAPYWRVIAAGAFINMARFSEAFILIRGLQMQMPVYSIPLIMAAMNLVYALVAYPLGRLADQGYRIPLLKGGMLILILADLLLANAHHWLTLLLGAMLWGLHMGFTQGILAALVAMHAAAHLKGTAFGFFYLTTGLSLFFASAIAGLVWQGFGFAAAFYLGIVFALLALWVLAHNHLEQRNPSLD